jgi:hypothetical protein
VIWDKEVGYMKHGKRPTVAQKKLISKWRLNPDNWLVTKHTSTEMHIVHRVTSNQRIIKDAKCE